MSPKTPTARNSRRHRVPAARLRWRCDPSVFRFRTTRELGNRKIEVIGQPRALESIRLGLNIRSEGYNIFVNGPVGSGRSTIVRRLLEDVERGKSAPDDLVFVHNFRDPDQPQRLAFPAGQGTVFRDAVAELVNALAGDLHALFESELYAKRRARLRDQTAAEQKAHLKDFETRVQSRGFAMMQVQTGSAITPQLVPVVAGNPTEIDKLEELVDAGQFSKVEFDKIGKREAKLRAEMESVGKELRRLERLLHHQLAELDVQLATPLIDETFAELQERFPIPGLPGYIRAMTRDLLENLDEFHEGGPPEAQTPQLLVDREEFPGRYAVNVVVDNAATEGRPIIWETAPSYRNLFGTIETTRTPSGEYFSDHTRIRAGSLLRANGGILVIDAMDLLVEPGCWSALKRTLRNERVEVQVFDPLHAFGISLKPEPVPIDVKVVLIGTSQIYRALYSVDEDFKKVFKVKAEFAHHTPRSTEELRNYAAFVTKKIRDDDLLPFHRQAVAVVVEEGVRIAGHQKKLTTSFKDIADIIRESGYWAAQSSARWVRAEHVDQAVEKRAFRVNLIEELMRERMTEGIILLDLKGEAVGQINGLTVLDLGDHAFGQPARITATVAMGRAGVIAIDREARLSGTIHAKGVLILTGFLRSRFARNKPLSLTASIAFEQNYGRIDGDSASSAELYALLSALSGVPIRQGVAVTGSVNQRGEIQPIGGANEKVEGFFELCRHTGLTGDQGVLIPRRNLMDLMLRKDLVAEVRKGAFHIWAVDTIEEGLEVLTGEVAGKPGTDGGYPPKSVLGKVDAELTRLAVDGVNFAAKVKAKPKKQAAPSKKSRPASKKRPTKTTGQ